MSLCTQRYRKLFQINPDSAKGYKIRGMSRAMLGLREEAASDLHVASKLDFDEEISIALKKVIYLLSTDGTYRRNPCSFCNCIFWLDRLNLMPTKLRSIGENVNA